MAGDKVTEILTILAQARDQVAEPLGLSVMQANLAILGLLAVIFVAYRAAQRPATGKPCKWTHTPNPDDHTLGAWTCKTCGHHGYSPITNPPYTCLKGSAVRPLRV